MKGHTIQKTILRALVPVILFAGNGCDSMYSSGIDDMTSGKEYVALLSGIFNQNTLPPFITSTIPSNDTGNYAINGNIHAVFSKEIDPSTVNDTAFTVTEAESGTAVTGVISCHYNMVTFSPRTALRPNTKYTARVGTGIMDFGRRPLDAEYSWSFTTGTDMDLVPPEVVSTSPEDGSNYVPVNSVISITFNEAIDPATATSSTINVSAAGRQINGTVSAEDSTVTFTPLSSFNPRTQYHVYLSTGIRDTAGNAMSNIYIFSFESGSDVVPVNPPLAIAFNDVDYDESEISGTLSITKAVDETDIYDYVVYWGSGASAKLTGSDPIAVMPKTGSDLQYNFPIHTAVPAGATHLLVFTRNNVGEHGSPAAYESPDLVYTYVSNASCTTPRAFYVHNSKLYFNGISSVSGQEPWVYDISIPTGIGTNPKMLANLNSGHSYPDNFITFKSKLYFAANIDVSSVNRGKELVVYDDSQAVAADANPKMVFDINSGSASSTPYSLTYYALKDRLIFTANDGTHGTELWCHDGTDSPLLGTNIKMVYDHGNANGLCQWNPQLIVFNNKVYFTGDDGASGSGSGKELWVWDGTDNPVLGTNIKIVYDHGTGTQGLDPSNFIVFNSKLYFKANDGSHGSELWCYDGTDNPALGTNIKMVYDYGTGTTGLNPSGFTVYNSRLYFKASESEHGEELWMYDGSDNPVPGTNIKMLYDVNTGSTGSGISSMTVFNSKLYFQAWRPSNDTEMWVFDDMLPVADNLNPFYYDRISGPGMGTEPASMTSYANRLFFKGFDGIEYRLWVYFRK